MIFRPCLSHSRGQVQHAHVTQSGVPESGVRDMKVRDIGFIFFVALFLASGYAKKRRTHHEPTLCLNHLLPPGHSPSCRNTSASNPDLKESRDRLSDVDFIRRVFIYLKGKPGVKATIRNSSQKKTKS